jgi:hypothetical protein
MLGKLMHIFTQLEATIPQDVPQKNPSSMLLATDIYFMFYAY